MRSEVPDSLAGEIPAVLLVDDNDANLMVLEAVLESLPCELVRAHSGIETLRRVREREYAAILMDVMMPGLDGFATASFIRQGPLSSDAPIIFITGADVDSDRFNTTYGLGVGDVLIKPLDPDLLRSKVDILLELFRSREQIRDLQKLRIEAEMDRQARDDLIAMVAHDLRTPLTLVGLSTNLLLRSLDGAELSESSRNHFAAIQRGIATMDRMVGDLLDISRVQAGKFVVQPARHSLLEILEQAIELLRPAALEKNVGLNLKGNHLECAVHCERDRILQVLSNLIGNAIKFTVPPAPIVITYRVTDREAIVAVQDAGPGIPPEEVIHVFDKYWQAKGSEHQGVGLGLTIAKGIVEAHRGRIWAESTLGQGATLLFSLPLARP